MSTTRPVRTAIIGLSSSAVTSWAADAHLPVLVSGRYSDLFTITALCNSGVAAAESAIQHYHLDPSVVKPYGNPADLAADPDVELVLCNTRVDKHYETILPSVQAGKSVYIEWPIASNLAHIEELVAAYRANNNPSQLAAVGLQGRFAPPVVKIKEILQSGRLGKLLSTEVRIFGGTKDRQVLPTGLKYFAQREVGGNSITIGFGHVIDFVQSVVGDVVDGTDHTHFGIQRPEIGLRDPETGNIVETIHSDVPDLLSVHGSIAKSDYTAPQASLVAYFARGQPFPGDPALSWTLNCEKGTIRLNSPTGIALQANAYESDVTISVHLFETDKVEQIAWAWSEAQLDVPMRARSVQTCLVNIAQGYKEGYVSLEDAANRARQISKWLDSFPA
ncbi:oxidoreductase, putative [Talaromyces stipitatus ATCC 10500]|uniref:Oxidoreductase, putative n=1 Tax=Talaromyces stipitatus (strain ATCC 10500 / CBS 375.48 / QM 6759 / NRRL 1006) TaxID=441959 RepID=B8LWY4_TALSN|nr:oxidoreductase, putative [Talaromyces stipitatus ATCC 10500]EED24617.1 oxidoreductase, putative [Talaromyces stipitatus ATCC 10500]